MSFESVPILDLALARDPDTKPFFLSSLRDALLKVGFLYIKNTGIDDALIQDVISQGRAFFDLPQEEKLKVEMKNVPSFLGASLLFFPRLYCPISEHMHPLTLCQERLPVHFETAMLKVSRSGNSVLQSCYIKIFELRALSQLRIWGRKPSLSAFPFSDLHR